jgi:hypothetical protein
MACRNKCNGTVLLHTLFLWEMSCPFAALVQCICCFILPSVDTGALLLIVLLQVKSQ